MTCGISAAVQLWEAPGKRGMHRQLPIAHCSHGTVVNDASQMQLVVDAQIDE